ncbi:MAG TPA: DUF192 domain-containing protein [Rickettsiales bacterium]|nr:DUF192 domain-containing protein [Rickettsiales bacterium]
MRLFAALTLSALLPFSSAYADTPIIYSQAVIKIVPSPASLKEESLKEAEKSKTDTNKKAGDSSAADFMPILHRVVKEFTVEIRPLSFLQQHDFIAHQPFNDREGMMTLIDPPAKAQLKSSNLLGKVDVLFVKEDGIIDKIAPELSLPDLSEPIDSDKPIRAFIFLKDGAAQASDIRPGDSVEGSVFKAPPVILK